MSMQCYLYFTLSVILSLLPINVSIFTPSIGTFNLKPLWLSRVISISSMPSSLPRLISASAASCCLEIDSVLLKNESIKLFPTLIIEFQSPKTAHNTSSFVKSYFFSIIYNCVFPANPAQPLTISLSPIKQKTWDCTVRSSHVLRLLHCPSYQKRATLKAHAICTHTYTRMIDT